MSHLLFFEAWMNGLEVGDGSLLVHIKVDLLIVTVVNYV